MWQELYTSLDRDDFEIISVAEDSQGEAVAGPLFDKAAPTFRCVVDDTHRISTLFGWVNVPSAAWIDEDGRIVRSNEGTYAGEHTINAGIGSIEFGSTAFAEATRDWVENGAASDFVWSADELRERLKPTTDDALLADPTFKLALHFQALGDEDTAQRLFGDAQRLAPDNWNYHRQGWTHRGEGYAAWRWLRKTKALRADGGDYYAALELPGEPDTESSQIEFVWTRAANRVRELIAGARK